MTKRRTVRKADKPKPEPVLLEDESVITNYDKVRYEQRGLDTFTIKMKEGEDVVVLGHDIALDQKGTQDAKLPIYQIFEYVLTVVDVRHRKAFNEGPEWDPDTQVVRVEHTFNEKQYVQVVKAILWPGDWKCVTREFGL